MTNLKKDKKDDSASLTAKAHGVSYEYVRLIVNGKRNQNSDKAKAIINTYQTIVEAKDNLSKPVETAA